MDTRRRIDDLLRELYVRRDEAGQTLVECGMIVTLLAGRGNRQQKGFSP
jgi:hypothetical protein